MDAHALALQNEFHLGQLSARNQHHHFEELCFYLARARITPNLLPATGPVSAGGDQGLDFEVFATASSDRPMAFACSLQKEIAPKIRADLKKIAAARPPFGVVHYFCTATVPVAQRHKLQTQARENDSIELLIYDLRAIAELLAAPDTIWIAVRYLGVPQAEADALVDAGNARASSLRMTDYLEALLQRPFAGRSDELLWLDRVLSAGGRALISGRAGYGKTLLLARWIAQLRQRGVAVAYYFFTDSRLSDVATAWATLAYQIAGGQPPATVVGLPPAARLRELIRQHSGAQPLAIVLDALDEMGADVEPPFPPILPHGVAVVASVRTDQLAFRPSLRVWAANAETISVQRLEREAVTELMRADSSEAVRRLSDDPEVAATLERVAEGYPLYLGFLLEDLRETGGAAASLRVRPAVGFAEYIRDRALMMLQSGTSDEDLRILATLAAARGRLPAQVLCAAAKVDEIRLAMLAPATARWLSFSRRSSGSGEYGYQHELLAEGFRAVLTQRVADARNSLADFAVADAAKPSASRYVVHNAVPHLLDTERWSDIVALAESPAFLAQQAAIDGSRILPLATLRSGASAAVRLGRPAAAAALLIRAGHASEARRRDVSLLAARSGDLDDVLRIIGLIDSLQSAIAFVTCSLELVPSGLASSLVDRAFFAPRQEEDEEAEEAQIEVLCHLLARLAVADLQCALRLLEGMLKPTEKSQWLERTIALAPPLLMPELASLLSMGGEQSRGTFIDRAVEHHLIDLALESCGGFEDPDEKAVAVAEILAMLPIQERLEHRERVRALLPSDEESFALVMLGLDDGKIPAELEQQMADEIVSSSAQSRLELLQRILAVRYGGGFEILPDVTFDDFRDELANCDAAVRRQSLLTLAQMAVVRHHPDAVRCLDALVREIPPPAEGKEAEARDDLVEEIAELLQIADRPDVLPLVDRLEPQVVGDHSRVRVLGKLALIRDRAGDRAGALRIVEALKSEPLDGFDARVVARTQRLLGLDGEALATLDAAVRTLLAQSEAVEEDFISSIFADRKLIVLIEEYANLRQFAAAGDLLQRLKRFEHRIAAADSIAAVHFGEERPAEALDAIMLAYRQPPGDDSATQIAENLTVASNHFSGEGRGNVSLALLRAAAALLGGRTGTESNALRWRIHLLQRLRGGLEEAASGFRSAFQQLDLLPPSVERRKIARNAMESLLGVTEGATGSLNFVAHLDGRSRNETVDQLSYLLLRDISRELGPDPNAFHDNFSEPIDVVERDPRPYSRSLHWRELAVIYWRAADSGDSVRNLLSRAVDEDDEDDAYVGLVSAAATACWTGVHDWIPDDLPDAMGEFGAVLRFDIAADSLRNGREAEALAMALRIGNAGVRTFALRRIAQAAADRSVREGAAAALEEAIGDGASATASMWLDHAVAAATVGRYAVAWSALSVAAANIDCARERRALEAVMPFNRERD